MNSSLVATSWLICPPIILHWPRFLWMVSVLPSPWWRRKFIVKAQTSRPTHSSIRSRRKALQKWPKQWVSAYMVFQVTSSNTSSMVKATPPSKEWLRVQCFSSTWFHAWSFPLCIPTPTFSPHVSLVSIASAFSPLPIYLSNVVASSPLVTCSFIYISFASQIEYLPY